MVYTLTKRRAQVKMDKNKAQHSIGRLVLGFKADHKIVVCCVL
jgi:hypothetical protein